MASPQSRNPKAAARRILRGTLPDAAAAAHESLEVRRALLDWLQARRGNVSTVAAFHPLPGEVDLLPLLATLPDLRWVLPRMDGDSLVFHHVQALEALLEGDYGVLEPHHGAHPIVPAGEIDVFLCPGLGFSLSGTRMGRGRGFYDRALSLARKDAVRIGITFRSQIREDLPAEPHDLPVHWLATGDGLIRCPGTETLCPH